MWHPERLGVRTSRTLFIPIVLLACLLSGPLGALGRAGGAEPSVPGCHPGSHVVCIGRADGGHSVHVVVGQTVTVGLAGSGLRWSDLHQVGPHLLHPRRAAVVRGGTLTASYEATAAGRTELRASGAPTCAPGQACPQFILLWQVRVIIVRRD
jgi:hypothetical protein